jgi:hypothetical protein
MMLEILGLVARVAFGVLLEVLSFWIPWDCPTYRGYLRTVPADTTPLSKREWKAAGKPERPESPTTNS